MKKVFVDADYLIALLNPKEQLHQKAKSVAPALGQASLVTSEMVLVEVLAFYAERGPILRKAAAEVVFQLKNNPNVVVFPQTTLQFEEALSFYRERTDKSWSLTDCASFKIMQAEAIIEALTHDDNKPDLRRFCAFSVRNGSIV